MSLDAAIGIDIGGTKTLSLLFDEEFKRVEEIKFKTHPGKGAERLAKELTSAIQTAERVRRRDGSRTACYARVWKVTHS